MRATRIGLLTAVLIAGMLLGAVSTRALDAPKRAADPSCGAASSQLRTTLYFGTARPKGSVSELEWQMFLRDEVTSRFPDGLTVWEAEGQWKQSDGAIGHERSKVLLLVHPDTATARDAVQAVIGKYKKNFEQESVLWETARVCAVLGLT